MFREYIEEDNVAVVFETSKPVLFSIMKDGTFNKTWEPWTERHFELKEDSTLVYRKKKDKSIIKRLDLTNTKISKMELDVDNVLQGSIEKEVGIVVTCTNNGFQTSFRCILNEYELHKFFYSVQNHVVNPTVEPDALNLDTYHGFKHYGLSRDKFMDITTDGNWAKENEIRIERYNKVVEIKDQIRYDKLFNNYKCNIYISAY
jgi:hypothetical protein